MTTNANSGLGAICQTVDESFDIKTYAIQLAQSIQSSGSLEPQAVQAAQFFQAMFNQGTYTTSSGQTFNFASMDPSIIQGLKPYVVNALNSILVSVPLDKAGDSNNPMMMITTVNGKTVTVPATLGNLLFPEPGETFEVTIPYNAGNTPQAPAWCSSLYQLWDQPNVPNTNLSVGDFHNSCSGDSDSYAVSGTAEDWNAAMGSNSFTYECLLSNAGVVNNLSNYLSNNF